MGRKRKTVEMLGLDAFLEFGDVEKGTWIHGMWI